MEARNGGSGALLPGGAPDTFSHGRAGIPSTQAVQNPRVIKQTIKIREGKVMSQSSPDDATAGKTKQSPAKSARRLVQRDGLSNQFRTASAAASCPAHEWVTPLLDPPKPRRRWGLRAGRPSHQRILDAFIAHGPMTPDELAEKIERSVFYTRPRCSELCAIGLLHRTGEAHINTSSGLKADVLSL